MGLLKTIKHILLPALLSLTPACVTEPPRLFYPPQPAKQYLALVNGKETILETKGTKKPPARSLEKRIPLRPAHCFNRFTAHAYRKIHERMYIDLNNNVFRQYRLVTTPETYHAIIQQGHARRQDAALAEREYAHTLYRECQRIALTAMQNTAKDLYLYQYLRPFFEFDLRRDKIPFTDKTVLPSAQEQPETDIHSIDEFEERILNPQKAKKEEPTLDWLHDKVMTVSIGLNVDINILQTREPQGIEPYLKWMDTFKLVYSTKNKTLEHKISFPLDRYGLGFNATTDQLLQNLHNLGIRVNYLITPNSIARFNFSSTFGKKEEYTPSFEIFIRF